MPCRPALPIRSKPWCNSRSYGSSGGSTACIARSRTGRFARRWLRQTRVAGTMRAEQPWRYCAAGQQRYVRFETLNWTKIFDSCPRRHGSRSGGGSGIRRRGVVAPAGTGRTMAAEVDHAPRAVGLAQEHGALAARTVQDHRGEALGCGHRSLICCSGYSSIEELPALALRGQRSQTQSARELRMVGRAGFEPATSTL